jgi:TfoX/Sxy family transcriptional regulator of competence genes
VEVAQLAIKGGRMAYDAELDARLEEVLTTWGAARKKMFGGTCYLLDGNIVAGVSRESLFVRLSPEEAAEALARPEVRPFDISKNPMSGWVMVGPDVLDDDTLGDWLERARDFVCTLPPK